jgi:hypothetical protein
MLSCNQTSNPTDPGFDVFDAFSFVSGAEIFGDRKNKD